MGKDTNVIIGVIYRSHDTDTKVFNEYVSELLDKIRSENKCVACLGDYNISLLNSDCHGPTQEFADLMYSYSLFQCITKPTRVKLWVRLIIFSVMIFSIIKMYLLEFLYTDISDHFPIIHIDKATDSQESLGLFSDLLQTNNRSYVL